MTLGLNKFLKFIYPSRLKTQDLIGVKSAECTSIREHFERIRKLVFSIGFNVVLIKIILMTSLDAAPKKKATAAYQPKYSAIVIDARTREVLHAEDPDGVRHPASLTKMMTLYMLFEAVKNKKVSMRSTIPISQKASKQSPSKLGLLPGQTISVHNAMLGLITKSANDVAVAVGEFLGGSEEAFARKMTLKAQALGMNNTIFKNASGLPNPQQVTTARDMAILSHALHRDFPNEYKHFATKSFHHKGLIHTNHNHLLGKVHGVDGIKTGFIAASGFNLAASAIRYDKHNHPHRLIAVVLGGANRHWRDKRVEDLLETYFDQRGLKAEKTKKTTTPQTIYSQPKQHSESTIDDLIYEVSDDRDSSTDDSGTGDEFIIEPLEETPEYTPSKIDVRPANWVVPTPNIPAKASKPISMKITKQQKIKKHSKPLPKQKKKR